MNSIINDLKSVDCKSDKGLVWPRAIVLTFILLALFDAYIITQAISTRVATTSDAPYIDSLNYEKIIEGKRAASLDGISMSINYTENIFNLTFNGLTSKADKILTLELLRPNDSSLDQRYTINSDSNIFSIKINHIQSGLWLIRASLVLPSDDNIYYFFETKQIIN